MPVIGNRVSFTPMGDANTCYRNAALSAISAAFSLPRATRGGILPSNCSE